MLQAEGRDVAAVDRSLTGEAIRYVCVSALGLATDIAALATAVEIFGLPILAANVLSFSLGVAVVYAGSVLWVFGRRRVDDRKAEFAIFFAVGLVGLLINQAALWAGMTVAALPYLAAKLGAAGASFAANFAIRKVLLFR